MTLTHQREAGDLTEEDIIAVFAEYSRSFEKVSPYYNNVLRSYRAGATEEEIRRSEDMRRVVSEMHEPSIQLFKNLRFSEEDNFEIFGHRFLSDATAEDVVGGGLLLYSFQTNGSGYDFIDCFLEVTGISAGIALVGGLTGAAGGPALVKAFKTVVTKVGIRTLSGIGLALMAAEFTWCMLRD